MGRKRKGWKTSSKVGNMGLLNLNGHVICAIDTETTGLQAGIHDLIEVAIVPLDAEFKMITDIVPFECLLVPKRPQNIDPESMKINKISLDELERRGLDPDRAAQLFSDWFDSLELVPEKKMAPLAKNWAFDAGFLKDWLGVGCFNRLFYHRAREVSSTINFYNDRAEFHNEAIPFPQQDLQSVATRLKVQVDRAHRAIDDALATAAVYRAMMSEHVPS